MFNFLSQFWDAITSAASGTVEFFENIGLAVAGALGGVLVSLFRVVIDVVLIFGYVLYVIGEFLSTIFSPFFYFIDLFFEIFKAIIDTKPITNEGFLNVINTINNLSNITFVNIVLLILSVFLILKVLITLLNKKI